MRKCWQWLWCEPPGIMARRIWLILFMVGMIGGMWTGLILGTKNIHVAAGMFAGIFLTLGTQAVTEIAILARSEALRMRGHGQDPWGSSWFLKENESLGIRHLWLTLGVVTGLTLYVIALLKHVGPGRSVVAGVVGIALAIGLGEVVELIISRERPHHNR